MNPFSTIENNTPWFFILFAVLPFVGYLVGVQLSLAVSRRFRSLLFIKILHLIVFLIVSGLLGVFLYEVITQKITYISVFTISIVVAEGVVLLFNKWRCPLTTVAELLGSRHGQVTDILLPKWFADRIFTIYTWLFVAGIILLVLQQIW